MTKHQKINANARTKLYDSYNKISRNSNAYQKRVNIRFKNINGLIRNLDAKHNKKKQYNKYYLINRDRLAVIKEIASTVEQELVLLNAYINITTIAKEMQ